MRAILLLLILLIVVAIGAIATGFININQTQAAAAPDIDVNQSGVVAKGGQAPQFDVETGKIGVGTQERTVKLPAIEVRPADGAAAQQQQQQANGVATTNATQP
uniref:hypothetical protein n=1 Tax=uncultured Sphingomonas sp. TaxID=158754 RepID=UPI0025E57142|nr:hypothetical protein [uncultured Sphingomonas sp.]